MKAIPLFVPLLAVVAATLSFHPPAPTLGARDRGQTPGKTDTEPRIAPIIGNGAYAESPLANPVNDARDMDATLRQLGFEVLSGENRNLRQMEDLIREFGRMIRGGGARSFRSSSRGLASIDAPVGTLIAYATAPGRTAGDGDGRNGLYTKELLTAMQLPGLKLEDVLKRARSEVRRQSNNQQIPWEASSIEGDFYFSTHSIRPAPTTASILAPTTLTPVTALPQDVDPSRLTVHNFMTAAVDAQGNVRRFAGTPAQQYTDGLGNGVMPEMVPVKGSGGVQDFWIGKYEVTQAQWRAVMGNNPSDFQGDNCRSIKSAGAEAIVRRTTALRSSASG